MNQYQLLQPFEDRGAPVLFGHRGCSTKAPENTLAAFEYALNHKITGIELDVQMCASGELVVIHDFDFFRISGQMVLVSEAPYENIRELDAGSWFDPKFQGEKIPLLSEVFELIGNKMLYDIEIKHRDKHPFEVEDKVVKLIKKFNLQKNCIISSFNPFSLRQVNKIDQFIPTALIYSANPEVPLILRRGQGRFFTKNTFLKPHADKLTRTSVFLLKRVEGYSIIPWTVNTSEDAKKQLEWGASALISRCPEDLDIT